MMPALLRHLVESTAFAAVMLLAVACLRRGSAATRHALLLGAALKFALPLQWLMALGAALRSVLPAPEVRLLPAGMLRKTISPIAMPASPHADSLLAAMALCTWLVVASLLLFVWLRRLLATGNVSGSASPIADAALKRMKARLALTRNVQLRMTPEDREPRLFGLWRATVVLPETLPERLTTGELEAVLLHELAHARRRDNLTRACVHALSCLFWFYPLLWWLERRMDAECELACDELVLISGASRQEYLDGILKVCECYVLEPIAGASNVSGSNLKQRMEVIMSSRIRKTAARAAGYVAGLLLASVAAAGVIAGFATATPGMAQTAATNAAKRAPVSCQGSGGSYPEGTVLQVGAGPEQMCIKNPSNGTPLWISISDEARQRSQQLVSLPEPAPFQCKPGASSGRNCTCEGHGEFGRGAVVASDHGELSCTAGGTWRPYKRP